MSPSLGGEDRISSTGDVAWTLTCAAMVFFMQAGFALVESGCCRFHSTQSPGRGRQRREDGHALAQGGRSADQEASRGKSVSRLEESGGVGRGVRSILMKNLMDSVCGTFAWTFVRQRGVAVLALAVPFVSFAAGAEFQSVFCPALFSGRFAVWPSAWCPLVPSYAAHAVRWLDRVACVALRPCRHFRRAV